MWCGDNSKKVTCSPVVTFFTPHEFAACEALSRLRNEYQLYPSDWRRGHGNGSTLAFAVKLRNGEHFVAGGLPLCLGLNGNDRKATTDSPQDGRKMVVDMEIALKGPGESTTTVGPAVYGLGQQQLVASVGSKRGPGVARRNSAPGARLKPSEILKASSGSWMKCGKVPCTEAHFSAQGFSGRKKRSFSLRITGPALLRHIFCPRSNAGELKTDWRRQAGPLLPAECSGFGICVGILAGTSVHWDLIGSKEPAWLAIAAHLMTWRFSQIRQS
ncbi:hypothetical protein EYF80_031426 [Liparis tanakae]|uniref:Uncharacterized protein n=1 Tax=Liparis tanakae TaxID=230148 RepID=A0A4Z2H017_9TELE|nr:hypothetical protein EYF80_031426 [Liparis tanakae]